MVLNSECNILLQFGFVYHTLAASKPLLSSLFSSVFLPAVDHIFPDFARIWMKVRYTTYTIVRVSYISAKPSDDYMEVYIYIYISNMAISDNDIRSLKIS